MACAGQQLGLLGRGLLPSTLGRSRVFPCTDTPETRAIVYATDNTNQWHWHSENPEYRLLTDQLPDSWEDAIEEAAEAWSDDTDITIEENTSSAGSVYRGPIPVAWQSSCPPDTSLACTKVNGSSYHITDGTIVFNEDKSMGTSSLWCALGIGVDVQTVALHELGHLAGWLGHSSDAAAAMYESYNGCQRTPDSHDVESMDEQYSNHP